MNIKITSLIILSAFILLPNVTKAERFEKPEFAGSPEVQNENNDRRIDLRKLELKRQLNKNAIEDKRERLKEARENFLNATPEERESLRKEFRNRFMDRFVFAVDRLSEFHTRMSNRLDKMTEEGLSTEEAKNKLSEAKTKLDEVKTDIESLKTILNTEYNDEQKDAKKEDIKNKVEEIKTGIKEEYQKTKEVFALMKELNKPKDDIG